MNAVLSQLAIAIGGVMFIVVMIAALSKGVPIMVAIFRASIVMCLSSLVVAVFFRFLSSILRDFVMERINEHSRLKASRAMSGRKPARPRAGTEEKSET